MGIFYQEYIDCGKEFSDSYSNTPHVSNVRNNTPRFVHLAWNQNLDPSNTMVEFFNYAAILPFQQSRTFTTRGSFGLYPRTSPDMTVPLQSTVVVPNYAQRFRLRIVSRLHFNY